LIKKRRYEMEELFIIDKINRSLLRLDLSALKKGEKSYVSSEKVNFKK
jgi:hypothetical protein